MLSARASDGNRDEWLQFCQIAGEHGGQKIRIAQSEIACAGLGEDVVGHGLVFSSEMTQFINPVGVLQEAHVDDVIGVEGQAVLESEGFDGDLEGALLPATMSRMRRVRSWTLMSEVSMTSSAARRRARGGAFRP